MDDKINTPTVPVEGEDAPVKQIDGKVLAGLGQEYRKLFENYARDRKLTEEKWLRNLRQYLGVYDPDIERALAPNSSKAYPRLTRVKCVSMVSRIMNLMFPGNEKNWEVKASPSADMSPEDVKQAVLELQQEWQKAGMQMPPTAEILDAAVQNLAAKRAEKLSLLISDQMQEIGGDQSLDYISLNRAVVLSGVRYGLGVLSGPFVREEPRTVWRFQSDGTPEPAEVTLYKPQYEAVSVWDFYPDMSARTLPGEGYFIRHILGKSGMRELANRPDFFADEVKKVISSNPKGNYKPQEYESQLRTMGTATNVNDQNRDPNDKFEVVVWHGPIPVSKLKQVGADIPERYDADDIEAELWMVDNRVIKADINGWRKLGMKVKMIHTFVFDDDDTTCVGNGLPNVMRDSQMSVCAATRMTLDNASVTCGPNLEVNTSLLRPDQDLASIEAYKIWYRDDDQSTAQYPAVRKIDVDGHLGELQNLMTMFMGLADIETFISPMTGGDMSKMPSEPFRTASGASALKGDAALPFKDIVRNFDTFTQSVILSLVAFNKKYNPSIAPEGDYNVIARGATSLIAKEVRGIQIDQLAQTLTDEEKDNIDMRKFARARLAARDMDDMLVPESQAQINREQRLQAMATAQDQQNRMAEAAIRDTMSGAYKNIAQARKNEANAEASTATAAVSIMEKGMQADGPPKTKAA